MSRCEDFPCCGHEAGCCPDFDASGRQLNMICVCGAILPVDHHGSLCDDCDCEDDDFPFLEELPDFNEDMDGDFDSGMTSAGFGTDEDYGVRGKDSTKTCTTENN